MSRLFQEGVKQRVAAIRQVLSLIVLYLPHVTSVSGGRKAASRGHPSGALHAPQTDVRHPQYPKVHGQGKGSVCYSDSKMVFLCDLSSTIQTVLLILVTSTCHKRYRVLTKVFN